MEPYKYSFVGHLGLSIVNPISSAKLDEVIALTGLDPSARVLDVGCGKGEILIRFVERYGCSAVGVDRSHAFIADAQAGMEARLGSARKRVELHALDAQTWMETPREAFDVVCCVGATHVFGDARHALSVLSGFVRPGGYLLFGEGHWKREPPPEYLASFGGTRDELTSLADTVAAAVGLGLVPHYVAVASDDDFDRYEWLHARNIELYVTQNPLDLDGPELLARSRAWRAAYLRWGRDTMGFALHLLRKGWPA